MTDVSAPGAARLYRYFQAKWALQTLATGELRVSRLAELNDPFEFRPALPFVNPAFSHQTVDEYLGFLVRDFDPRIGIICFSEEISDPGADSGSGFVGVFSGQARGSGHGQRSRETVSGLGAWGYQPAIVQWLAHP